MPETNKLDISKVLTTIGVTIAVGGTEIAWAHDCGDFGGEPSGLDCTPLSSKVKMEKSGIVEQEQWEISYFYNDSDYDYLETLRKAGESKEIIVTMNNGRKFKNNGVVAANYLTGLTVNGMSEAKAVLNLSNQDGWTKEEPTAGV